MSGWANEYLESLQARDAEASALAEVIDAYAKIVENTRQPKPELEAQPPSLQPPKSATPQVFDTKQLEAVRKERDEARSQSKAFEGSIETLKSNLEKSDKQLSQFRGEVTTLRRRLKDLEAEARDKARLLDNLQNETIALNLQLNVAEDQASVVRKENEELIQRWKQRTAQEADEMNKASRF